MPSRARPPPTHSPAATPRRILILGGTAFLGPAAVAAAKQRSHAVTLFNRGRTEKRIGVIEDVERLYGNRDPNLPADESKDDAGNYFNPQPHGLESPGGKSWDAVIDTSGQYPRLVNASAELLAPNVRQYIYISSISAYAGNSTPNEDESAALATLADPTVESMGPNYENFGGLKALCEMAAQAAMPGRVAVVRPGLNVGPGDPTDRFTYWPLRIDRGGEVLAPGTPNDPVQLIDVRDLGEWIVRLIEDHTTGTFNAINPAPAKLTIGQTLEACNVAASQLRNQPNETQFTWVSAEFLEQQKVSPWMDMPLWVPPIGEFGGFHLRSNARAVAAGLGFRPIEETASAILNWWPRELERRTRVTAQLQEDARRAGKSEPQMPDSAKLRAGIDPQREVEVLKTWHGR
jgi:2'-hydroxyisoflavone reductase